MNFMSDNAASVSPEILAALEAANRGPALPYGNDELTKRVEKRIAEVFETDCAVFPVATGTAANALSLACLAPPWGAVFCHEESHVYAEECGAPEFYSGGAKLVTLNGPDAKIDPAALERRVAESGTRGVHQVQPAAVSVTQATDTGTVYSPAELSAIAEVCRRHDLGLHMDGARFANALVAIGCAPADITWRAGVDVLSFGATKNGAMGAEAVVFFRRALSDSFGFRRKRGGHLFSKMRYLSVQLDAYLAGDLWLRNAHHANAMAARLAAGLERLPGARFISPVEANEIFVELPEAVLEHLENEGFRFYRWGAEDATTIRLVTAFDTRPEDVDAFLAAAGGHDASGGDRKRA